MVLFLKHFAVKTNTAAVILVSYHPFACSNLKTKMCIHKAEDAERISIDVE